MDDATLKVLLESAQKLTGQLSESLKEHPDDVITLVRKCYELEKSHLFDEQRDIVQNKLRSLVEDFVNKTITRQA